MGDGGILRDQRAAKVQAESLVQWLKAQRDQRGDTVSDPHPLHNTPALDVATDNSPKCPKINFSSNTRVRVVLVIVVKRARTLMPQNPARALVLYLLIQHIFKYTFLPFSRPNDVWTVAISARHPSALIHIRFHHQTIHRTHVHFSILILQIWLQTLSTPGYLSWSSALASASLLLNSASASAHTRASSRLGNSSNDGSKSELNCSDASRGNSVGK